MDSQRDELGLGALSSAIFEASVDSMVVIDEMGVIQALNKAALDTFGYAAGELLGCNVSLLMPAGEARAHDGYLQNYRQSGQRKIIGIGREVTGRRKDASEFPLHLSIAELQHGGRRLFVGICHDISERRRMIDDISHLATHDSLTGCLNRHQLLVSLQRMLAEPVSHGWRAVIFIDLDGFKQVNDRQGHRVGDRLLGLVAERLQRQLRPGDLLARVGGDEFVALIGLPPDNAEHVAHSVCKRLLESLCQAFRVEGLSLYVNASIGVSFCTGQGCVADQLIHDADLAMYQAKGEGGGCIRFFQPEMRWRTERRVLMLERLRDALAQGRFELHYQLQLALDDLRITGLEALLRWTDAELGQLSPDDFIPVAIEYGLMPAIDLWVLRRACMDNRLLIDSECLDVPVAVNIGSQLFQQRDFAERVQDILSEVGLPGRRLELEVTETGAMDDAQVVTENIQVLKRLGVTIAMDDFGTGFSSLLRLRRLAFDRLKIDRSFVRSLPAASDQAIVQAALAIAASLELEVVAEGVETAEQLEYLRRCGCTYGQGFWFARPMPLQALRRHLALPA
ncbi:EAL domain-containing protein [Pseudomonas sp. ABC1]|uniref:putative bifunctional diguanylate cyclase/phosphodiesterase n=1 Tax=Pseudomonas sp. ABC1 TaxID=2748080 RepID=UPI0015C2E440|nr:GGDEF domain-containing phosphodiesterase [Pseudomonas sp. ABC1]QLF94202.1 EAL domain-containing protein [Pseudomonas sp. ABC1]